MDSRRSFVKKFALGVSACALPATGIAELSPGRSQGSAAEPEPVTPAAKLPEQAGRAEKAPDTGSPPWSLVRPLAAGASLGWGWVVADLGAVENGAATLTLRHVNGRRERVHLCRNDGRPCGATQTDAVDLLIMNGGAGALPTDHGLGLAVLKLGRVIAGNEARQENRAAVSAMMPHRQRLRRFAVDSSGRMR